jgi:hypothetical protein
MAEQVPCIAVAQHLQADLAGSLGRGQARQLVPAGDHHRTAAAARQQGTHLIGVAGVVQDDEHPPASQQAAVQALLSRRARRDPVSRDLQRVQEPADRVRRGDRLLRRIKAAQVDIQLAIRELIGSLMSPVHRQRGLPDASCPADHGDHPRPIGTTWLVKNAAQRDQLVGPADEERHRRA